MCDLIKLLKKFFEDRKKEANKTPENLRRGGRRETVRKKDIEVNRDIEKSGIFRSM